MSRSGLGLSQARTLFPLHQRLPFLSMPPSPGLTPFDGKTYPHTRTLPACSPSVGTSRTFMPASSIANPAKKQQPPQTASLKRMKSPLQFLPRISALEESLYSGTQKGWMSHLESSGCSSRSTLTVLIIGGTSTCPRRYRNGKVGQQSFSRTRRSPRVVCFRLG